jgi:hypothetical protein
MEKGAYCSPVQTLFCRKSANVVDYEEHGNYFIVKAFFSFSSMKVHVVEIVSIVIRMKFFQNVSRAPKLKQDPLVE